MAITPIKRAVTKLPIPLAVLLYVSALGCWITCNCYADTIEQLALRKAYEYFAAGQFTLARSKLEASSLDSHQRIDIQAAVEVADFLATLRALAPGLLLNGKLATSEQRLLNMGQRSPSSTALLLPHRDLIADYLTRRFVVLYSSGGKPLATYCLLRHNLVQALNIVFSNSLEATITTYCARFKEGP